MDISLQYLAGMADSDGSFTISKTKSCSTTKRYHYRSMFQLTWKKSDKAIEVLKEIQKQYGGSVFISKNNTKYGRCEIVKYSLENNRFKKFLDNILPYLLLKKEQAEIIIEFKNGVIKGKYHRGKEKPEEVWAKEDFLYLKIKNLNAKNKNRNETKMG